MPGPIVNYDGSITTSPKQLIYPKQSKKSNPSQDSARSGLSAAMGSEHPFQPRAPNHRMEPYRQYVPHEFGSSGYQQYECKTFTAQAGLQFTEASKAPPRNHDPPATNNRNRQHDPLAQPPPAATKDALDGITWPGRVPGVTKTSGSRPSGDPSKPPGKPATRPVAHGPIGAMALWCIVHEVTFQSPLRRASFHVPAAPRTISPREGNRQSSLDTSGRSDGWRLADPRCF